MPILLFEILFAFISKSFIVAMGLINIIFQFFYFTRLRPLVKTHSGGSPVGCFILIDEQNTSKGKMVTVVPTGPDKGENEVMTGCERAIDEKKKKTKG